MPIGDRLIHRLVIERPTIERDAGGDPVLDDYGQPLPTWPDLAAVRGLVQPKSAREMALISEAGVGLSEYTIYLLPTDLQQADRFRFDPDDGRRYEVRGIRDAAGLGHHLEVDAHLTGEALASTGS